MISIPENRFNRAQRTRKPTILHERLQRLNRDLAPGKKDFDYLYAIRHGLRIRVCVMRDPDNKFFATAQIGNRAFRVQGGCPSGAFIMLSIVMNIHIVTLPAVERERLLGGAK